MKNCTGQMPHSSTLRFMTQQLEIASADQNRKYYKTKSCSCGSIYPVRITKAVYAFRVQLHTICNFAVGCTGVTGELLLQ